MEREIDDLRIEDLRKRAVKVRADAVKGLVELDKLEAELEEVKKEVK